MSALDGVRYGADGLVPVAILDARDGTLLTLAYANAEAVARTVESGETWLWSRSRGELWRKGATSGNTQRVVAIDLDCDGDALAYRVIPDGPACHTGAVSCFSTAVRFEGAASPDGDDGARFAEALRDLAAVVAARDRERPAGSYTTKMLEGGVDRIGKKIGEEATEVVIAAKNADAKEIAWEVSDLLYHVLVLLRERGVRLDAIGDELARRKR